MSVVTDKYPCAILLKEGLSINDNVPKVSNIPVTFENVKLGGYGPNNEIIFVTQSGITLLNPETKEVIKNIELAHIERYSLSPTGRYLTVWQLIPLQYVQGQNGSGPIKVQQEKTKTLHIYDIKNPSEEPIFSLFQNQVHVWPIIQFNITETVAVHLENTVTFYTVSESTITKSDKQFNSTVVRNFSWSNNPESPDSFAIFIPENPKKSTPAMLRVCHYPELSRSITSISFFKSSYSEIKWSPKSNLVLCKAQTNIDTTGQSYYGESSLHIASLADSSRNMSLPQPQGPVYDAQFNPDGTLLASVAGFMPATVEIFKVNRFGKLDSIKKFTKQSRNELKFSPNGQFLAVAGFGNCPGEVDVYETQKWSLVAEFSAHCTTEWCWTLDSKSIIFCGCFPRRHFENFIKICPINAPEFPLVDFGDRLYHFWLKPQQISKEMVPFSVIQKKKEAEVAAYVPPSLRGKSSAQDDSDPMPKPGEKRKKTKKATKVAEEQN